MKPTEVNTGRGRMSYSEYGEGYPVILLHGFGENGSVWRKQLALASENLRLIIPDIPGSGSSPAQDDMSMEGMAETLKDFAEAIGLEKFMLIGHSMGGYIALAFAEKYPDSLTAFSLFHSSAYADTEEKKEQRRKGIQSIRTNGADTFLDEATKKLFSDHTKSEMPSLVEEQLQTVHGFTEAALVAYYEAMMARPDRTGVLRSATMPVLFVVGRHDAAIPFADVMEQTYLPGRSMVAILENSGHLGMLEEVELANKALGDFVAFVRGETDPGNGPRK